MISNQTRMFLLNIETILLVIVQILAAFCLLAVTEIVPINYTIALSTAIQSVVHASANVVLTRGEIINCALIMLIGGQIWLNQVMQERRELMKEIEAELPQ